MIRENDFYITISERVNVDCHRSKIIIHRPNNFIFAEFENIKQLNMLARKMDFTYQLEFETEHNLIGKLQTFSISHAIKDPCVGGFWKKEDLPDGVKPIKARSNGSIVDCYFLNDGETITIFRPNPNAKEVYTPLELHEHIEHGKIYGSY